MHRIPPGKWDWHCTGGITHKGTFEGIVDIEKIKDGRWIFLGQRFGLKNRGLLKKGMAADIVVFDAENLTDRATYENPFNLSSGISHVIVNGTIAAENGITTGAHAGRALPG